MESWLQRNSNYTWSFNQLCPVNVSVAKRNSTAPVFLFVVTRRMIICSSCERWDKMMFGLQKLPGLLLNHPNAKRMWSLSQRARMIDEGKAVLYCWILGCLPAACIHVNTNKHTPLFLIKCYWISSRNELVILWGHEEVYISVSYFFHLHRLYHSFGNTVLLAVSFNTVVFQLYDVAVASLKILLLWILGY